MIVVKRIGSFLLGVLAALGVSDMVVRAASYGEIHLIHNLLSMLFTVTK